MRKFIKNSIAVGLSRATMVGSAMPVMAASKYADSTASVAEDHSLGADTTQDKKTEYAQYDADTNASTEVYVTQASKFSVTVPVVAIISGTKDTTDNLYKGYVRYSVSGNIAADEYVAITPDASFKMSQTGKNDIDCTVNGVGDEKAHFIYDDLKNGNTDKADYVLSTADMTAGSWNGSYNTNIVLKDIKYIAHRGYMGNYPENSIVGIENAAKDGFDMVEVDLTMTSDNVPVVYHSTLDDMSINRIARTTDGSKIADTININEATYNDLLQYDFGIYKGQKFAGTKIATFEQALTAAKEAGINVYIDFHNTDFTTEQMQKILDIIDRTGNKGNIKYGDVSINDVAKNTDGTKMIKDFDPDATFYMALYGPNYYNNVLGRCKRNNISLNNVLWVASMNEVKNGDTSTAVKLIKQHNLRNLGLYSIDDNDTLKQAMHYGTVTVSTDYPIENLYK